VSNLRTAKAVRVMAAFAVLAGPLTAMATNGYFSHG
jgi:hypothetical protein